MRVPVEVEVRRRWVRCCVSCVASVYCALFKNIAHACTTTILWHTRWTPLSRKSRVYIAESTEKEREQLQG